MSQENILRGWNQRPDQYAQTASFFAKVTAEQRDHEASLPKDQFGRVMYEYRQAWETNTLTPDLVNRTWQTFWRVKAENANLGYEFEVPVCDRTTEELAELRAQNRGVVLLPGAIMTVKGLRTLNTIFPEIVVSGLERLSVFVQSEEGGCVDVEMDLEPPYRNHIGREIRKTLEQQRREGQRLQTYIIASCFSKELTGNYFDENTASTLLGTFNSQKSPFEGSNKNGNFNFSYQQLGWRDNKTGFRSEGRKQV